ERDSRLFHGPLLQEYGVRHILPAPPSGTEPLLGQRDFDWGGEHEIPPRQFHGDVLDVLFWIRQGDGELVRCRCGLLDGHRRVEAYQRFPDVKGVQPRLADCGGIDTRPPPSAMIPFFSWAAAVRASETARTVSSERVFIEVSFAVERVGKGEILARAPARIRTPDRRPEGSGPV